MAFLAGCHTASELALDTEGHQLAEACIHLIEEISLALQVEVLVEMAAQSQQKQGKMNVYTPLVLVEAVN